MLLVGLFMVNVLHAQTYGLDDVYEDENKNIWKESSTGRVASGLVYGIMQNGLSKGFELVNGKIEGKKVTSFEDGSIFVTCNYANGLKNGNCLWYSWSDKNDRNQISRKENFINGLQVGKNYTYYTESGNLKTVRRYKDGKRAGKEQWFYDSGEDRATLDYLNGKKNSAVTYFKSGKISGKRYYSKSQEKGITYFKNGKIKSEFEIINNNKGSLTTYQKGGSKEYEISILDDEEFIGFSYINSHKSKMNDAQILNYLKTREWKKAEGDKSYF